MRSIKRRVRGRLSRASYPPLTLTLSPVHAEHGFAMTGRGDFVGATEFRPVWRGDT
jgi:hypothetical protein